MRTAYLVFGVALAGLFSVASSSPAMADHAVRCESDNYAFNHCPANTYGGVELRRQLSNTECREGDNWGYDRRGIWVDRGCAGEFIVESRAGRNEYESGYSRHKRDDDDYRDAYTDDYRDRRWNDDRHGDAYTGGYNWPPPTGHSIRCESENFTLTHCPVDIYGNVELRQQLSNTECRRGENWGYDRRGIWVDRGCAGEFRIG